MPAPRRSVHGSSLRTPAVADPSRSRRSRTRGEPCHRPAGRRPARRDPARASRDRRPRRRVRGRVLSPCHISTTRSLRASCSTSSPRRRPRASPASLPAYRKRRSRRRYSRRRRRTDWASCVASGTKCSQCHHEPAIPRRVEVRQVVAVADRAPALGLRVDAAQAEHQADEADRGEDVEEEAEERDFPDCCLIRNRTL